MPSQVPDHAFPGPVPTLPRRVPSTSEPVPSSPGRRDAARNRQLLLDAARAAFASDGVDVPLSQIAVRAGVSRTTLHRHFPTRPDLVRALLAENVDRVEARAAELAGRPDGVARLFDFVLDLQGESPTLIQRLTSADAPAYADLGERTAACFAGLLDAGTQAGVVCPSVGVPEIMVALQMASVVAAHPDEGAASSLDARARAILRRGLFAG